MNKHSYVDFSLNSNAVTKMLTNKKLFINEEKWLNLKSYYETEWKLVSHRWSAFYTSTLRRMNCTTTQRAESGRHVLKKKMAAVQPLQIPFEAIADYLDVYERQLEEIKQNERSTTDVLVYDEKRLKKRFGKETHKGNYLLRMELHQELDDSDQDSEGDCSFKRSLCMGCYAVMICQNARKKNYIVLSDIPRHWWVNDEEYIVDDRSDEMALKMSELKPWMKYVFALENRFR